MEVRLAEIDDKDEILAWRNDPVSREMFLDSSLVSAEAHERWMVTSLSNPLRMMYIGLERGRKVGICRFDHNELDNTSEVSINIAPEMRGRGLGASLLSRSVGEYKAMRSCPIWAKIKNENIASLSCFQRSGFAVTRRGPQFTYVEIAI